MTREQVASWLESKGWKKDRWVNYKKSGPTKEYRMKLEKRVVRYEVKVNHAAGKYHDASTSWVRLRSGYYKKLSLVDGKLSGLVR